MQLWKAVAVTLAFMGTDIGTTTAIYIFSHLDRSLLDDIRHFNVFDSVLDLWAACLYRSCLLLGATIGVAKNSALGPRRLRASRTAIAVVCLFAGIYAMVKLLLFSEVRKPVRDPWFWALFVWTYVSLAASFLLWWLLSTVRPNTKALEPGAGAEAEGFPGEEQRPPEQASGATLQKLLSYTRPDAAFLVAASFFLIVAALGERAPAPTSSVLPNLSVDSHTVHTSNACQGGDVASSTSGHVSPATLNHGLGPRRSRQDPELGRGGGGRRREGGWGRGVFGRRSRRSCRRISCRFNRRVCIRAQHSPCTRKGPSKCLLWLLLSFLGACWDPNAAGACRCPFLHCG